MSWILLTNDDGVDSPALSATARALRQLTEVRVVVPDRERSWIGKAITRFEAVEVDARGPTDGIPVWTHTGTPADGVQLGIHTLFDDPPSLVVSGINLGYNHGAAFLLSSGTVGAATEAWLGGVPGIALSTGVIGGFAAWRDAIARPEAADDWGRVAAVAADVVEAVWSSDVHSHADIVSVNLPWQVGPDTPRRVTRLARVGYDQLFHRDDDGRYRHGFAGGFVAIDDTPDSDVDAGQADAIAITPLRMPSEVRLPEGVRAALER